MKQKILFVLVLTAVVFVYQRLRFQQELQLIFCDVGQGDATLVQWRDFEILVDGGPNDAVLSCLGQHLSYFDRTIEFVIATHQDSDHIGGLASVLANYKVDTLIWNGEDKETADFLGFYEAIQREQLNGTQVIEAQHGESYQVTDLFRFRLWVPRVVERVQTVSIEQKCEKQLQDTLRSLVTKQPSANDGSIVTFIEFGTTTVLLMGDLETRGELTLVCSGLLRPTTIVKAGHHGSKSSSTRDFIAATQPEYVVFSSGKNNRFGHPSPEVMSRYELVKSVQLRTDQLGTIVLLSDGSRVWRSN